MSKEKPTLPDLLNDELARQGETPADVQACVADSMDTDKTRSSSMDICEHDMAYPDFTAWTLDRVYYLHEYDGQFSCQSVPRNPPPPKN
jgi:hypothetical protein